MLRPLTLALTLAALPLAPTGATAAQSETELRFAVELRGLRAGTLRIRATETASAYAAAARIETTGLARMLRPVRFDADVQGRRTGASRQPLAYSERVETPRRDSRTELAWSGRTPRVLSSEPARDPQPWDIDPATQTGTLDPLSVLLEVLSDVPADRACRLDLDLYDGRRRGRVTLTPNGAGGCTGAFHRIAGYPEEAMAEATRFPFALTYAEAGNGTLRVTRVEAETPYGTARLTRD